MLERRIVLCAAILPLLASPALAQQKSPRVAEMGIKKPKYYFQIREVNVGKKGDKELGKTARELFENELLSRPEFTNEHSADNDAALFEELKKRGLKGFDMSLRLDKLTKDLKDPKPGGRLKQLSVDVKLSVFGTTFPGEKLAFTGEGESVVEAEIVEARLEQEGAALVKEVMPNAIRQAVDQFVAKLSMPKSAPMNESKRKRKK